jgi:hypothetical protein
LTAILELSKESTMAKKRVGRPKNSIAKKVNDSISRSVRPARRSPSNGLNTVYQLKVTLIGFRPAIWRRIQVLECSLDNLHEYIQTAMGWTNSHLHHFDLDEQLYGDPELMQENFRELNYKNSRKTMLSEIVPENPKRFRFVYEYDFGDSWNHDVLFERRVPLKPSVEYPVCVAGKGACPPEDVGGVWGYANMLDALEDKKHERHADYVDWIGGEFDPDAFDSAETTDRMQRGLPDWKD